MVLNQKRVDLEILPREGSEALAQAARSSCGCPIPGSVPGQAGRGWGQPGLVGGVPMEGGWNQMNFKVPSNPTQPMILQICDESCNPEPYNTEHIIFPIVLTDD